MALLDVGGDWPEMWRLWEAAYWSVLGFPCSNFSRGFELAWACLPSGESSATGIGASYCRWLLLLIGGMRCSTIVSMGCSRIWGQWALSARWYFVGLFEFALCETHFDLKRYWYHGLETVLHSLTITKERPVDLCICFESNNIHKHR